MIGVEIELVEHTASREIPVETLDDQKHGIKWFDNPVLKVSKHTKLYLKRNTLERNTVEIEALKKQIKD